MALSPTQIEIMAQFVISLTIYYGATEIPNDKGHRQFTNPWSLSGGDPGSIFILKESGRVKFGVNVTRSNWMSEKMVQSIASRQQRVPVSPDARSASEPAPRER